MRSNIIRLEDYQITKEQVDLTAKAVSNATASIPSLLSTSESIRIAYQDITNRQDVDTKTISDYLVSIHLDIMEQIFLEGDKYRTLKLDDYLEDCQGDFALNFRTHCRAIMFYKEDIKEQTVLNGSIFALHNNKDEKIAVLTNDDLFLFPTSSYMESSTSSINHLKSETRSSKFQNFLYFHYQDDAGLIPQESLLGQYINNSVYSSYNGNNTYEIDENAIYQGEVLQSIVGRNPFIEEECHKELLSYVIENETRFESTKLAGNWMTIPRTEGSNLDLAIIPLKGDFFTDPARTFELSTNGNSETIIKLSKGITSLETSSVFNPSTGKIGNASFSIFPAYQGASTYKVFFDGPETTKSNTIGCKANVFKDANENIVLYQNNPVIQVSKVNDKGEETILGVIIPLLRTQTIKKIDAEISIDFGTSNTYICAKHNNKIQDIKINTTNTNRVVHTIGCGLSFTEDINRYIPHTEITFPIPSIWNKTCSTPTLTDPIFSKDDELVTNLKWAGDGSKALYIKSCLEIVNAVLFSDFVITKCYATYPSIAVDGIGRTSRQTIINTLNIPDDSVIEVSESIAPIAHIINDNDNIANEWLLNIDIGGGTVDYIVNVNQNQYLSSIKFGANYIWNSKRYEDLRGLKSNDLKGYDRIENASRRSTSIDDLQPISNLKNSLRLNFLFSSKSLIEKRNSYLALFAENDEDISLLKQGMLYHFLVIINHASLLLESVFKTDQAYQDLIIENTNINLNITLSGSGSRYLDLLSKTPQGNDLDNSGAKYWLDQNLNSLLKEYSKMDINLANRNNNLPIFEASNIKKRTAQGAFLHEFIPAKGVISEPLNLSESILEAEENGFYILGHLAPLLKATTGPNTGLDPSAGLLRRFYLNTQPREQLFLESDANLLSAIENAKAPAYKSEKLTQILFNLGFEDDQGLFRTKNPSKIWKAIEQLSILLR